MSGFFDRVKRYRAHHPVLSSVSAALLLAAIIEYIVVPLVFHDTRSVRELGDRIADAMIRLGERIGGGSHAAVPFVFVDIDADTWRLWGRPLVVPRSQLAQILNVVTNSKPLLVVLDVDLAWSGPDGQEAMLAEFLQRYPASAAPLVLIRSLISEREPGSVYPMLRPTQFDPVIAQRVSEPDPPTILWTTAYFDLDPDGVIRRWRLAEPICRLAGDNVQEPLPAVLPSAHLTAAVLASTQQDVSARRQLLDAAMDRLVPATCQSAPRSAVAIRLHHSIEIAAREPGNRIIYSFRWHPEDIAMGPLTRIGSEAVPLVSVRPARLLLAPNPSEKIDGLEGRIVIVGGSFRDSGDLHRTPLGMMPGALLIANAAHALMVHGTPRAPGPLTGFSISFGLVVVNALLFHFFRVEIATIAAAVVVFVLMILTLPLFTSGVVLDYEVPSAGILLHRYLASLERAYHARRDLGWRTLLRSSHRQHR